MALRSVLQTALSGMAAAETVVAVVANNLANARTRGYKAVSLVFATQQPQTQSHGAAGQFVPGATELSNTDIAESLVDLQVASNLFRANLQVADTPVHLLDELIHLRRAAC